NFWKELTERTTKYSIFEPEKTPYFTGFFSGANSQLFKKFRVLNLRPLGQLSICIYLMLGYSIRFLLFCQVQKHKILFLADLRNEFRVDVVHIFNCLL
ncbi:MAG: hypothetical protein PUB20_03000, partial [Clostridia bacterium]|nr:hypothetical protein [Clostridia bacterium]